MTKSYEKYLVKPDTGVSGKSHLKYKITPNPTTAPTVYETDNSFRYVPLNEFKDYWKKEGKNPKERLEYLDKEEYVDRKTGLPGVKYVEHEPTWTERLIKEPLHGATIGLGTTADLASNYVAAPLLYLGSKIARGAEHLAFNPHAKQINKKAADDLQSLSDKYWNQNVADEARNDPWLRTKNRDTTAAMLRGGGEFIPDLIPANALGTLIKRAAGPVKFAVKKTAPVAKGFIDKVKSKATQLWNAPKATYVADMLETPYTGKTAAGFAGAGAGRAYINTDNFGDQKKGEDIPSWYEELPFMIGGAGAISGAYSGVKNGAKSISNSVKKIKNRSSNDLSFLQNHLAKRINSGNNKLDEKYIKLEKKDLNPFNIYEDNQVPFKIARHNPTEEYQQILPKMKERIGDDVYKQLDKHLGEYDGHNPTSTITHIGNLLSSKLKTNYGSIKELKDRNYRARDFLEVADDYVVPTNIHEALDHLIKESSLPMTKGSGIGKLHEYGKYLKAVIPEDRIPLKEVINLEKALQQIMRAAPEEIGGMGSREILMLNGIEKALNDDIVKNGVVHHPHYLKNHFIADHYYKNFYKPYQQNKVFKKLNKDLNIEKLIERSVSDRNSVADFEKLLGLSEHVVDKQAPKMIGRVFDNHIENGPHFQKINKKNDLFNLLEVENKTPAQKDFKRIQRLVAHKKLLNNNNNNELNIKKLLKETDNAYSSALYNPEMAHFLDKNVKVRANKYNKIVAQDLKHKSSLGSLKDNNDYYHNKYDITKHFHNWPTLVGGAVGGTYGSYIGGLIGAAGGGLAKSIYSKKVFNSMTDKKFVDELIRLGRIPKVEKQRLKRELSLDPSLKTEIIRIMFEKKDEKDN